MENHKKTYITPAVNTCEITLNNMFTGSKTPGEVGGQGGQGYEGGVIQKTRGQVPGAMDEEPW